MKFKSFWVNYQHFFRIIVKIAYNIAFLSLLVSVIYSQNNCRQLQAKFLKYRDQSEKKIQHLYSLLTPTPSPTFTSTPTSTPIPTFTPTPTFKLKRPTQSKSFSNKTVTYSSTLPYNGYARLLAKTDVGNFVVDVVGFDLNQYKVIVDTASESDCSSNCPVLPLHVYVSRNNAVAGINGSYFCPASYPSCKGKENSFDTLLMNKNKVYFNSQNNVYSVVPAVIFKGTSVRYVRRTLEWGRDTSVDAVLANQPLLVLDGQVVYFGDNEVKRQIKSNRSFVGSTGSIVYFGVVRSSTASEAAKAIHALGIKNALNLDSGGSTALWYQGYKAGPGRNIPNALLIVRR